jgi:HSP20 family protein
MRAVATDPLRTLRPLREEEVELLSTAHKPTGAAPLAYDVYRTGDELVMEFDAPGVAPTDISVAIEGRAVIVSLRRQLMKGPRVDVIESGRQHGLFRQRLWLGDRWDLESLRASAEHGVLTLRAPLAAQRAPRAVAVTAAAPSPVESAHTSLAPPSHSPAKSGDQDGELVAASPVHSAA